MEAEKHLKTVLRLAKKSGDVGLVLESHLLIGDALLLQRAPDSATRSFRAAARLVANVSSASSASSASSGDSVSTSSASDVGVIASARASGGLAAVALQLERREEAREMLRRALGSLKELPPSAARLRAEADLIHRIALSWVAEGRRDSGLPLWRAAIEAVDGVAALEPASADQTRHAKALIGCCISAAKGAGRREGDEVRGENELSAAETVSQALQADQIFERVFRNKIERPEARFSFESLWTGYSGRFDKD